MSGEKNPAKSNKQNNVTYAGSASLHIASPHNTLY